MKASQPSLPKWILIVSGIIALLEIGVSLSIFFSPGSVLEKVDLSARGVTYLANMWGIRQFALGFIFAYATIKRSVPMLTIAYIFFLVMFIGDLLIGITEKENALIVSALIMIIISSVLLYALHKRR